MVAQGASNFVSPLTSNTAKAAAVARRAGGAAGRTGRRTLTRPATVQTAQKARPIAQVLRRIRPKSARKAAKAGALVGLTSIIGVASPFVVDAVKAGSEAVAITQLETALLEKDEEVLNEAVRMWRESDRSDSLLREDMKALEQMTNNNAAENSQAVQAIGMIMHVKEAKARQRMINTEYTKSFENLQKAMRKQDVTEQRQQLVFRKRTIPGRERLYLEQRSKQLVSEEDAMNIGIWDVVSITPIPTLLPGGGEDT